MRIFKNPIILKEFQEYARSKKIIGAHLFYNIILFIFTITIFSNFNSRGNYYFNYYKAQDFFTSIMSIQLLITLIYAAARASTSIINEKNNNTFELLILTSLTPAEIIFGKVAASVIYYLLFLFEGLPFVFLIMIAGGFSIIDIFISFIVIATVLVFISLFGILYSANAKKTVQSIIGTFVFLVVLSFFSFSTFIGYRYGYSRVANNFPFFISLNPMIAIFSFLKGKILINFFGHKMYLIFGFFIFMITLIIFLFFTTIRIIKSYYENIRVINGKLYLYMFTAMFVLLSASFWIEFYKTNRDIYSAFFVLYFIFSYIFVTLYIDKHSKNTDYSKTKFFKRLWMFSENHELLFYLFFLIPFHVLIFFILSSLDNRFIFSNITNILYYFLILIVFMIWFHNILDFFVHYFKTKKGIILTSISIIFVLSIISIISSVYQDNDVFKNILVSLNPLQAIVLITSNRYGTTKEFILLSNIIFYALFTAFFKFFSYRYIKRKKAFEKTKN